MTTLEAKNQNERLRQLPVEDQLGSLAESARRHLAYEALARQIATSENALQQVLDALSRARLNGPSESNTPDREDSHARNHAK